MVSQACALCQFGHPSFNFIDFIIKLFKLKRASNRYEEYLHCTLSACLTELISNNFYLLCFESCVRIFDTTFTYGPKIIYKR